jgi:hypothetical protein
VAPLVPELPPLVPALVLPEPVLPPLVAAVVPLEPPVLPAVLALAVVAPVLPLSLPLVEAEALEPLVAAEVPPEPLSDPAEVAEVEPLPLLALALPPVEPLLPWVPPVAVPWDPPVDPEEVGESPLHAASARASPAVSTTPNRRMQTSFVNLKKVTHLPRPPRTGQGDPTHGTGLAPARRV